MSDESLPSCRCGHARGHAMVSAEGQFTFMASVATLIGISARPYRIKFVCRRCGEVIEQSSDPVVLKETRLWG